MCGVVGIAGKAPVNQMLFDAVDDVTTSWARCGWDCDLS